jgi:Ion channel
MSGQFASLTSGRFFWLLVAMVSSIVVAALTPPGAVGKWESSVPLAGILIAGVYAARGGKRRLMLAIALNAILAAVGTLYITYDSRAAQCVFLVILLVCLLFNLLTTLSFVLTAGRVGPDHIYGAICSYVFIAMSFATIYTLQALAIPGAFNGIHTGNTTDRTWEDMLYFSITTLSTVGYGDITPLHRSARAICSVEMLTGTFYVAILIARLAGLYPPPSRDGDGRK